MALLCKIILLILYANQSNGFASDFGGDLKEIKSATSTIIGYLQNWNTLYLNQIEPKLSTSNINIANIDSNVKNLQEKAYIWNNFQLHITAWNEQLASTDRKLDILLNGQETGFDNFGSHLTTFSAIDYKIDEILKNVTKLENVTAYQRDIIANSNEITNNLKLIERKIANHVDARETNHVPTKASMPHKIERMMHDVSSKVDVIFDAIANDRKVEAIVNDEEYVDDQEMTDDAGDFDVKLFKLILSRLNRPCRETSNVLKTLANKLQKIENNFERSDFAHNIKEPACANARPSIDKLLANVKDEIQTNFNAFNGIIEAHFLKQQTFIEKVLRELHGRAVGKAEEKLENYQVTPSDKSSCDELGGEQTSGIYRFAANESQSNYFTRYCEVRDDAKWTVIQRRGTQPSEKFHNNWYQYKRGFGKLNGDFWYGNDFIHRLTADKDKVLRIELESFDGETAWAEYRTFVVDSEANKYRLTVGEYRGNATDSFSSHNRSLFSTYDRKNDDAPECCPCAVSYGGGWWFNSCFESNLNGNYHYHPFKNNNYQGLIWDTWLGNVSLKRTKMMVRDKRGEEMEGNERAEDDLAEIFDGEQIGSVTDVPYYEDP